MIAIDITMYENQFDQYEQIEYAKEKKENRNLKIKKEIFFNTSVNCIGVENNRSQPDHWHWISFGSISGVRGLCWIIGIRLISIDCCGRDDKLSDIGEKDNGRLPLPSLEENDGVDNRES